MMSEPELQAASARLAAQCLRGTLADLTVAETWLLALEPPDLIRLDDIARTVSWSRPGHLGSGHKWAGGTRVEDYLVVATVASFHRDGYLRERAVRALADRAAPLATRALVLRTIDHVPEVRTRALEALLARVPVADARDVLGLLLRVSNRTHGQSVLSQFLARLESLEGSTFASGLLATSDVRVRRYAHGEILARGQLEGANLEAAVGTETDQWSRRLLAQQLVKLDAERAKNVLLHGRYVEGRLIALFELPADVMDHADLERRLLDRSPRIRGAAQWRYRQAGHDPASYYRERWEHGPPEAEAAQVLSGLSETGQRLSIAEALAKSKSREARVRLAGLQLWPKPGPPKAVLFDLLDDESPAVVRHVAAELSKNGTVRYSDLNEAASSDLANARRAAWLVRTGLGPWSRVRGDLEAMQDSDPGLSGLAEGDLSKWLRYRAATVYQRPLPSEKAAIVDLLARADLTYDFKVQLSFHAGLAPPAPELSIAELELNFASRSAADDYNAAQAGRIRAAIASVRQEIRRLPTDQAESRLSEALGSDRAVFPPEVMTRMVRTIQDPWWPAKHPLRALRELRERSRE